MCELRIYTGLLLRIYTGLLLLVYWFTGAAHRVYISVIMCELLVYWPRTGSAVIVRPLMVTPWHA